MTAFTDADLRGARFVRSDLSGVVMRGVDVGGADIDALEVRADRVAMVRGFLATVTADELAEPRKNPWSPGHPETVLSCLHTILGEEWEHHRYAVRDLETLEVKAGS